MARYRSVDDKPIFYYAREVLKVLLCVIERDYQVVGLLCCRDNLGVVELEIDVKTLLVKAFDSPVEGRVVLVLKIFGLQNELYLDAASIF